MAAAAASASGPRAAVLSVGAASIANSLGHGHAPQGERLAAPMGLARRRGAHHVPGMPAPAFPRLPSCANWSTRRSVLALMLALALASALAGCGGDRTAERRAARATSAPPDAASWPLEAVHSSFVTIRYPLPGGYAILCSGVATGPDGTILTCWHLIDGVCAALAGGKVYGAGSYAFPSSDSLKRYRSLLAAPPREVAFDIEYGGVRSSGATLVGWLPDHDLSLLHVARSTPHFLRPGSASDGSRVGMLGLGAGVPPTFSFGHLTGTSAYIPTSDGDSGGPLFTLDGHLVAIMCDVSSDDMSAIVSPISAQVLDTLRHQQELQRERPSARPHG
jgi:hypothetical protein